MTSRLGALPWPEVSGRPLVLVPVGSLEQHGPHLPLETDTVIAEAVAAGVAERLTAGGVQVLLAPPLSFGASGEHEGFPGTGSIGAEATRLVVVELCRSMSAWSGPIVIVNGHGGNVASLRQATDLLTAEGRTVVAVSARAAGGDLHAGRTETSLLLHLAPASVRRDRLAPGTGGSLAELLPLLRRHGVGAVSPSGVLGDPRGASAEEGGRLLAEMVQTALRELTGDPQAT